MLNLYSSIKPPPLLSCSSLFSYHYSSSIYKPLTLSSSSSSSWSVSHSFRPISALTFAKRSVPCSIDKANYPGFDLEHWLIVMDPPYSDMTRDEIITTYIKTLATVVGSERDARMKIYSVSTRHYYAFGALISEELSCKIARLKNVRWVFPDSYLDASTKDYGGEPFIDGEAVPYDPKYHKYWIGGVTSTENDLLWLRVNETHVESQTKDIEKEPKTSESAKKKNKNKPMQHNPVFLGFIEDFRKTYKEEYPENKSVVVVAKEGGEEWKSLTDEEKNYYFDWNAERRESVDEGR